MINKIEAINSQAHQCLKEYWGYDSFRPDQLEVITSVLQGRDTVVLFPTGGGKSMCYQVPALLSLNLTIVISPLIALMDDQVTGLKAKGINAAAIHSGIRKNDVDRILDNCKYGNTKLLYISPERFVNETFFSRLCHIPISILAIDEAHCISQWGYDFRPSYLQIGQKAKELNVKNIMALTATATDQVLTDIQDKLELEKPNIYKKSFKRDNISLAVRLTENKYEVLKQVLAKDNNGHTIIYIRSRRDVKNIALFVNGLGISAEYYHAGLDIKKRNKILNDYLNGDIKVICATNAFGMGLDKGDIRLVVHFDTPPTIEEYVQEYGRAGRDGNDSKAIMIINKGDQAYAIEKNKDKYPPIETCLKIYTSLYNYHEIPIHQGEGITKSLNIYELSKYTEIPIGILYHGMGVLERNGYITTYEQRGLKISAQIICDVSDLRNNKLDKDVNNVLLALVRIYESIMDFQVEINVLFISNFIDMKVDEVEKCLLKLHSIKWIILRKTAGGKKISFTRDRLPKSLFHIDLTLYNTQKNYSDQKIKSMVEYLHTDKCRSQYILQYFNETTKEQCGKCDNCLASSQSTLASINDIQAKIEEGLE